MMTKTASTAALLAALAAPLSSAFAVPVLQSEPASTHEEMNLAQLADRLRETKAIPVFQKLSLKGQIDDLLAQFRAAQPGGRAELSKLKAPYNAMVDKIYSMLKKDPTLGQNLLASREAIWEVLSDPTQVASLD